MFKNLKDLIQIFNFCGIKGFSLLIISIIINSAFELISIGMLIPFISSIIDDKIYLKINDFLLSKNLFNFEWIVIENKREFLIFFIFMILLMYTLKYTFNLFFNYYLNHKKVEYEKIIANKIIKNFATTSNFYFLNIPKSKILNDINSKLSTVSATVVNFANLIVEIIIFLIISLFVFITIGSISAIVLAFFIISFFIFFLFYKKKAVQWSMERGLGGDLRSKNLLDLLEGIREIIIFSKYLNLLKEFDKNNTKFLNPVKKILFWNSTPKIFLEFLFIIFFLIFFLYHIYFGLDHSNLLVKVGILTVILLRALPSLNRIIYNYSQIKYSTEPIISIKNLLIYSESTEVDNQNLSFNKKIQLSNITFGYQKNKKIFQNLDLTIHKNKKIGLVGETGSGKSTLIDIITGIKKTDEGSICVDDKNINEENVKSWLKNIAYVSQRVYLFNSSLRNNITFISDDEKIDEVKFKNILKTVNLENFLNNFEEKELSHLGEFGSKVSGGQRQMIGIARAIYSERPIIILDESTNSLDEKNEKNIIENILSLSDRTLIFVTHKIENLKNVDEIYKLDNHRLYKL
tara:strand:+ start:18740 stop:20464 length:1725 start_codon:yes stop_codon:yes gene_type:complete